MQRLAFSFHSRHLVTVCASLAFSVFQAQAVEVSPLALQSSYETWKLPGNERMGMARLGLEKQFNPYFSAGVDGYTAMAGERGGFITLGVSAGLKYPLAPNLQVESGLFVGGGGGRGGRELTGGGLMLRENLGLRYQLSDHVSLSSGYSWVNFPDHGTIKSRQLYAGLNVSFDSLTETGQLSSYPVQTSGFNLYTPATHDMMLSWREVRVSDATTTDTGGAQSHLGMIGVRWKTYLSPRWYATFETEAASKGNSRGYMDIMAGLGYRYPVSSSLNLYTDLNAGGGGGGGTNTGGGLLWDWRVGTQYHFDRHWFLDGAVSRFWSPSTNFRSQTVGLSLGYQFGPQLNQGYQGAWKDFDSHGLRLRVAEQTYLKGHANWRNLPDQSVHNLGVQIDYFISPQWYLTGQGLSAVKGDAGAYSTGQVGAGWRNALSQNTFVELEALLGAAGGGGLNTGSGFVAQTNFNLGYSLNKTFEVLATLGESKALNGDFRAHVVGLSMAYKFNMLSAR
jgi:hypothetical protein